MRKIKYGMIGFGGIAENRLAKEGFALDRKRFAPLAEAELVGATDLNPARRAAVEKLGLKWYDDAGTLLADPALEAVFVATNNLTHAQIGIQALLAGKHVIVEKPIAAAVAEARTLCDLAQERQRSLTVDHMMIGNVYNRKAKELLQNKVIGEVNDSCFHMEFSYGATPEEAATWRCSKVEELGGPIGDVASHCLYVAEFLFDSPVTELACVYYPKLMKIVAEDGAYLKFQLANGLSGSVRVAFSELRGGLQSTLDNLGYEIFGTQGVMRGHGTLFQLSGYPDEPVPVRLEIDRFTERYDVKVDHPANLYQQVIRHHAQSILDGKPLDGRDGLHNLELISAAHASAKNGGQPVRL